MEKLHMIYAQRNPLNNMNVWQFDITVNKHLINIKL